MNISQEDDSQIFKLLKRLSLNNLQFIILIVVVFLFIAFVFILLLLYTQIF